MEFTGTRDFSEFTEQLNEIRNKFMKWDSCEKTVALYYLMVGLPFANVRFLQNALDKLISSIATPENQLLERNANDSAVINSFLKENPQSALCLLLNHLPLLRPGCVDAARAYVNTIRKILTEFITPPFKKIYNECVEIMSYVYIHPAFDMEEKKSFKHLLKEVIHKVSPDNFVHSPVNDSSGDEGLSPHPEVFPFDKKRSNSLTPAGINDTDTTYWSSQENLSRSIAKPRSFSLSCDNKTMIDHNHILQTSSSETMLQEAMLKSNQPLMKSILSWLKSLRLHKYCWLFNNLTPAQMLSIDEEYLNRAGVTKGAKQKLLLSLQKLRDRGQLLRDLEIEIMNGGDINEALKKLKSVLQSPLQVSFGEDLPSQFIKVMGKACTQLLMLRTPTDENLVLFNSLCERADNLESFTVDQKKRLNMWKGQLVTGNVLPICPQRQVGHNKSTKAVQLPAMKNLKVEEFAPKSSSYPDMQNNQFSTAHRHSVDSGTLRNQLPAIKNIKAEESTPKSSSYPDVQINRFETVHRHSVDSISLKNQLATIRKPVESDNSYSYFSHSFNKVSISPKNKFEQRNNKDIESSLESLCLQMMEHALGP